eukprot:scaffold22810_cov127-Isochrysis_galbana.AAC.3
MASRGGQARRPDVAGATANGPWLARHAAARSAKVDRLHLAVQLPAAAPPLRAPSRTAPSCTPRNSLGGAGRSSSPAALPLMLVAPRCPVVPMAVGRCEPAGAVRCEGGGKGGPQSLISRMRHDAGDKHRQGVEHVRL